MVLEISESEMIERFIDSLKKSASRADEFMKSPVEDRPVLFIDFIDGLKVAAGSAHQIAVTGRHDPNWLKVRDLIENIIEIGQQIPTFSGTEPLWNKISLQLTTLSVNGKKMFNAKSRSKQDISFDLNERAKNAPGLNDTIH